MDSDERNSTGQWAAGSPDDGRLLTDGGGSATLRVENVGGIDETAVTIEPGLTVLTGRNATNRTSLLRAVNGVLGGTSITLKRDADEGRVELDLGGETYTRTLSRVGDDVQLDGEPYPADDEIVDLFVSLLGDNEARRAVADGDLREVIMRPVDTAEIERRIRDLQRERERVVEEIDRVESRRRKLPRLEERRQELESEIESVDDRLAELRETVAEYEGDATDGEDPVVAELDSRRGTLREVREEIEVVEAELAELRSSRDEKASELSSLSDVEPSDVEDVRAELRRCRESKQALDDAVVSLSNVVEFNERVLDEGSTVLSAVGEEGGDGGVAAELKPAAEQEVACWTCGSTVERGEIADQLDALRDVVSEKRAERESVASEIESLEERASELSAAVDRRRELERELSDAEDRIEDAESELAELEEREASLADEVSELEAEVAASRERQDDVVSAYEAISECEYERGQLRQKLADVESELSEIEALPEVDQLESQRDGLDEELASERGRIERLEDAAVDAFNEHMDELLDVLEYDNLARVWIEKRVETGGRGPAETSFDMHVVRESEEGRVYDDVLEHCSESEREVVGLVLALAGYLTHEAHEAVPFLLLDSLEAIDAQRIEALVSYFAGYSRFVVVALLPEDAAGIDDCETIRAAPLS